MRPLKSVAGLTVAAATLFAAAPAFAADADVTPVAPAAPAVTAPAPAPAPAPLFDWSGAYAGASLGYAWSSVEVNGGTTVTDNGVLGGLFGGFNFQFDRVVAGIEAGVAFRPVDVQLSPTVDFSVDYLAMLAVRLGFSLDRVLPFVSAGVVVGPGEASEPGASDRVFGVGLALSAGVEVALTPNIIARADYLMLDVGSQDFVLPTAGAVTTDVSAQVARVQLGVKF